ncbi:MAG TPA: hypothetical protein VIJ34_00035 [Acidimicrobiales bacterium]
MKMPERTWTYAAGLSRRLGEDTPEWFDAFVAHVAARYSPSEACRHLGELGRLLASADDLTSLVANATHDNGKLTPLGWALEEFLSARGLVAAGGDAAARSRQRRGRLIARAPESLRSVLQRFADAELTNQRRAKRVGARPRSDQTLHIHLEVIVDFACANAGLGDWASVAAGDVEAFLAERSPLGSHLLPSLRTFFVWARSSRLVLVDPTRDLRSSVRRHFSGSVIDLSCQRRLFRRWTTDTSASPNEALIGLLALVHGVSVDELRQLALSDIDHALNAVALRGRAHLVPLDPSTWSALERVLCHRETLGTSNPHVLVNRRTKVTSQPVAQGYASDLLRPLGVSPQQLRCCRIAQLATTTDPMLVTELFGMSYHGVEYYLADQVDEARLTNL